MKILGIHADVCHLGGHTRLFLMLMDIFKSMGHKVHIVSRTDETSEAEVKLSTFDAKTRKPLLLPAKVKAVMDLSHHTIPEMKLYQPIRHLSLTDFSLEAIPVVYWGTRFLSPWPDNVLEEIEDSDYVFVDTEMYVRMESDIDVAAKHIQYVHFPTTNLMPVFTKEPNKIWCNSTFTRSWIRIRWGYNNPNYTSLGERYATVKIPKQLFTAEVVHPPIYLEDYANKKGFDDRLYDVVMFARLGEDKFTVSGFLNEHFKLFSIGALRPVKTFKELDKADPRAVAIDINRPSARPFKTYKPKGKVFKNIKFKQIRKFLSRAKVYVHGKGFGKGESGAISQPEHFGISICEAMAAGCPAVVPRAGGCWTDISMLGKYCLGYSSLEELKATVTKLVTDQNAWLKWHNLALERVQSFDVDNLIPRIEDLLG